MNMTFYADAAGTVPLNLATAVIGSVVYVRVGASGQVVRATLISRSP